MSFDTSGSLANAVVFLISRNRTQFILCSGYNVINYKYIRAWGPG